MNCKIIMPISPMGEYTKEHWLGLKKILTKVIIETGIENAPTLVSEDKYNPDILRRIYNSCFETPIIICDISGNNPNVLFELGLRVAFDMPIIIVKDEKTKFNFDIKSYESLIYPNDINSLSEDHKLRVDFESMLYQKIENTYHSYINSLHGIVSSKNISPLHSYLNDYNYNQIGRGISIDITGKYEYICYRKINGYGHGGYAQISRIHSSRNIIEWHLKGYRHWQKQSKDSEIEYFEEPIRWETKKAILFADKVFVVSYDINTHHQNIIGFIKGDVEVSEANNQIRRIVGKYHQDEGENVIKGSFNAVRVNDLKNITEHDEEFTLYTQFLSKIPNKNS